MTLTLTPMVLVQMFQTASRWLEHHREQLNALNVYPVPDGDTGQNMSLTLQSAVAELGDSTELQLAELGQRLSYGALLGARGNSGVLLSQLLKGFAERLSTETEINGHVLAEALDTAQQAAYRAVSKPVEGTILTVARAAAQGAARSHETPERALTEALVAAEIALAQTPELLPVLKQAGVVDSGAQGYVYFLKGLLAGLQGDTSLPEVEKMNYQAQAQFSSEAFGYCTEFLLADTKGSVEDLREKIDAFGDSILVVETQGYIKGHIHTDEPDKLLALAGKWGRMVKTKVEDMSQQHTELLATLQEADLQQAEVGLVAVGAGEGLTKLFREVGARVVSGEGGNPSVADFVDAVNSVSAKTVFILPNNKNILMAAQKAEELLEGRARVLPTRTLGAGMAAAMAFASVVYDEGSSDEVFEAMQATADNAVTLEVTHASRSAELQTEQGLLTITEGEPLGLYNNEVLCTADTPLECLLNLVQHAQLQRSEGYEILTLFAGSQTAQEAKEAIEEQYPDLSVECLGAPPELYDFVAVLEAAFE